ncbi:hypothetical protein BLNAU_9325 [Blattamonas nauphoetae]|uniref:Protein kinase domain-containing protein n=1 Tax=Blattamonas nauphoetae TaxID=2049346 RepID=A0ABQ9XWD6_9EUKA|nr:hypothetical protein BLNAU_9325 [Blattamonas nauphoetae]
MHNSTVFFRRISFHLSHVEEELNPDSPNSDLDTPISCATIADGSLTAENCTFRFKGTSNMFILSSPVSDRSRTQNVILLNKCVFKPIGVRMVPLCRTEQGTRTAVDIDITIGGSVLENMAVDSSSGIAACASDNCADCLSTTLSSVCLRNLTGGTGVDASVRRVGSLSSRVIGCGLDGVENGLCGTVTAPFCGLHSFLSLNSSYSNFTNEVHDPNNFIHVDQTYDVNIGQDRFNKVTGASPVRFIGCVITSVNPTQGLNFIALINQTSSIEIRRCTFRVTTTPSVFVRLLRAEPEVGSFPTVIVDTLKCEYSSKDTAINTDTIFHLSKSLTLHVTASNFTSTAGHTATRPFSLVSSTFLVNLYGCVFSDTWVSGSGGIMSSSHSGELIMSDCLLTNNEVNDTGGCVHCARQCMTFHRCVFDHNKARRGGVLSSGILTLTVWEDTHFEANEATEGQHFSGNDLYSYLNTNHYLPQLMVGCTSTSAAPKISYYENAIKNGQHPDSEILLPNPNTKTDYEKRMGVDALGSGSSCTETQPCSTINTAMSLLQALPKRNLIVVGTGAYNEAERTVGTSVEIVGNGWVKDSSFYTTLTSGGMKVGENGNLTLRSMTLVPTSTSTTLAAMDADGTLRLSFIRMEDINAHSVPLVSVSKGQTSLFRCWVNRVTLTSTALVVVSGSASLNVDGSYFMLVNRSSGQGASCIESTSSGEVRMDTSDYGNCSSSGSAGAVALSGKEGAGSVSLRVVYFFNNKAATSSKTDNDNSLFAHDLVIAGFAPTAVSINVVSSISPQISFLNLGQATRLSPVTDYGYSSDGVDFPLAGKYYQSIPTEQFSSIRTMTEQTFKFCARVAPVMNTLRVPIEQLVAENVNVTWRYGTVYTTEASSTIVTAKENSCFILSEGTLELAVHPLITPFVVEHQTGLFQLSAEKITFTSPPTTLSVPLFSVSAGVLQLYKCVLPTDLSFSYCSMVEGTGGRILLDSTAFTRVSSTGNGSVVHSAGTTVTSDSSTFAGCKARNGGAIWFEASDETSLIVTHPPTSAFATTFLDCQADEKGGAVCVEGTTTLASPIQFFSTSVDHARFSGSVSGGIGKDVFVGQSVFGSKPASEIGSFGGGSYSDWFHVEIEGRGDDEELEVLGLLVPHPIVSVNGSVQELTTGKSGTDNEACKWTSSFCATLGYGITKLRSKHGTQNIELNAQYVWNMTYTELPMSVTDQNVKLTGTTATEQSDATQSRTIVKMDEASTEGTPLFTVTNQAIFTVSNIDFVLRAQNGLFASDDTAIALTIVDCKITAESGTASSQHVVSVRGGSVWLEEIEFNTTSSSSSSFSCPIISVDSESTTVTLKDVCFNNIDFSTSSSLVHLITAAPITMTAVTFEGCVSTTADAHFVVVEGRDFVNQIVASSWEGTFDTTTPLANLWGEDSLLAQSPEWNETSLLYYLYQPITHIILNKDASNSSNHPNCGSVKFSCISLKSAMESLRESIRIVSMETEETLVDTLVVNTSCTFTSSTALRQVLMMSGAGMVEVNQLGITLTLQRLTISCDASSTVSTLFLPETVTSLVNIAASGSVSLTSSSISNAIFTHPTLGSAVIVQKGGNCALDKDSSILNIVSNAKGSFVLMFGDSFESIAKSALMTKLQPTLTSSGFFTVEQRNRLAGSVNALVDVIIAEWYPSVSGTQHVREEGVDHAKGGHKALPQLTITSALSRLGGDGTVLLDSDIFLAEKFTPPAAFISITSTHTENSGKEVKVENGGQISVTQGHLTLSTLSFSTTVQASSFITLSSTGSLTIAGCLFSGFSSASSGSVLSASIDASNSLSITDTEFSNCQSDVDGGVIVLTCSVTTSPNQIMMKGSFSSCSCGVGKQGDWVLMTAPTLSDRIVPSNWANFPSSFGTQNENRMWGRDTTLSDTPFASSTLLVYLLETKQGTIFVNSGGLDTIGCGTAEWPCRTLTESQSHLLNGSSSELVLQDASELVSLISNKWNELVVSGDSDDLKEVAVSSLGHISVPMHVLSLSFLDLTTTHPLFDGSLISISEKGSVCVDSCSFSSFKTSGSGSVVSGSLHASSHLRLTNTNVTDCSSGGDGGVIFVSCAESLPSSSLVIDCSFSSSCKCGEGREGGWVFLEGYRFEDLISAPNWETSYSGLDSPENDSLLWGRDESEPPASLFHSLSLLYYLVEYRAPTIFVGAAGRDSNGCGQELKPCRRLERGHSHLEGTGRLEVILVGSTSLSGRVEFDRNNLEMGSQVGRETITVSGDGCFMDGDLLGTHILTLSQLTFNLNDAKCTALFTTGVGQLILKSVSFAKAGSFDLELINLVGGEVIVERTTFSDATFLRAPFVFSAFTLVEFEKVNFENCSGSVFVEAKGNGETSKLTMNSCHFSGNLESAERTRNSEEICSWTTGMVRLTNVSATLRSVELSNGVEGGLLQEGGLVSMTNMTFSDNIPALSDFTSIRHNIVCSGKGTLITHLDSKSGKDQWIGGSDCTFKNGTEALLSPFFVPTLDASKSISTVEKKKTFSISVVGGTLIPCGLFLEVFEDTTSPTSNTTPSSFPVPLTEATVTSFSETLVKLDVKQSVLEEALNSTFKWSGRLLSGNGARSSEHFLIKISQADQKKAQLGKVVSIVIPIVASVIGLLLILLVILLLCRRRQKKTKQQLASQKELDQIQVDVDPIKLEGENGMDLNFTNNLIRAEKQTTLTGVETISEDTAVNQPQRSEQTHPLLPVPGVARMVEAVRCQGDLETCRINRADTLYERLHVTRKGVEKQVVMVELARALREVGKRFGEADVLTHLSSRWVMFDADGRMCVQLKRDAVAPSTHATSSTQQTQQTSQAQTLHTPQPAFATHSQNQDTLSAEKTNDRPRESFFRSAELNEGQRSEHWLTDTNNTHSSSGASSSNQAQMANIALRHSFTQPIAQSSLDMSTSQAGGRAETVFEGLRWQAPEVVQKSVGVDREKAAVFSLGLILWEIEAELVPFGEMDAVNAARQNETGSLPRMNVIADSKIREVVSQCLQLDPSSRPSLSSLLSNLSELHFSSSVDQKKGGYL